MKIELDLSRRAITAELYRRRAAQLRKMSADRSMSAVRQEMEAEAAQHEQNADLLMDYAESTEKVANVVSNPRVDIDQADAPVASTNGGER